MACCPLQVETEASSGGAASGGAGQESGLAEGLRFELPASSGIDAARLQAEGIGHVEEGMDDLMAQLNALSRS